MTDHAFLKQLHNLKDPKGCLAYWALILKAYNYIILYITGNKHQNANGLFQLPAVYALINKSKELNFFF